MKNFFILIFFSFEITTCVFSQPGTLDASFDIQKSLNADILSIAIQPDGKIIAVGRFNSFGLSKNGIIRFHSDGKIDSSFVTGEGFKDQVNIVLLQPDGKILVGGAFNTFNNITRNYITRLNNNGSLDTTFKIGDGFDGGVNCIAIQPDGKVVLGGEFHLFNYNRANYIVRLNPNGSLDKTFNTNLGFNSEVNSLAIQSDGKIIVGGDFSIYNIDTIINVAKLNVDGTLDYGFNTGHFEGGIVKSVAIQDDGKLLIGGIFNNFQGLSRNSIARVNRDGTIDTSFNPTVGPYAVINSIIIENNGKILCGGYNFDGSNFNSVVRLTHEGKIYNSFDLEVDLDDNLIYCLLIDSKGKLMIGGAYTGQRNYLARFFLENNTTAIENNEEKQNIELAIVNPNNGVFEIKSYTIGIVYIYDLMGKLILVSKLDLGNNLIHLTAKGIYLAQIQTEKGWCTKKIIVQ